MAAHKIGVQYRAAELDASSIDKDKRTASFSFSSEYPVERSFGMEVLDHSPGAADLSRLNGKGPVLLDHDSTQLVGVVEHAEIKDRRGMARVRFSRNVLGEQVFNDVVDGIRNNVSFGYRIHEARKEMDRDGQEVVRVTRFEPLEISMVGVPADPTVGMGRAYDLTIQERTITMTEPITPPAPQPAFDAAAAEKRIRAEVIAEQKREQEIVRNRDAEIDAIVTRWNNPAITNLAKDFRTTGGTIDEFKRALHDTIAKRPEALNVVPSEGMSKRDLKNYSILRAIRSMCVDDQGRLDGLNGLEREMSQEVARRTGRQPNGFYIPSDVMNRTLEVNTFTGAGALVGTTTGGQPLIDLLRNSMVASQLGVTMLSGLQGDVDIPRQTGAGSASWLSEGAQVSLTDAAVGQLALRPHRLSSATSYSKQLLVQASPDVESFVRNDMMSVIAIAKDLAITSGTGASGQPLGIINTTGLSTAATHTAAGAFSWEQALDYEENIEANNGLSPNAAFLMYPAPKKTAKTTIIDTGSGITVWDAKSNTINGYRAFCTNQLSAGAGGVIFGDWSSVILAEWDGMDVVVDPYSLVRYGQIQVVINTLCDVGVRQPKKFCISAG